MQADISKFGANIKKRRKQLGLTQKELSERVFSVELSDCRTDEKTFEQKRKSIVGYESGHFPKDPNIYLRLCNVLECDMLYLFGFIDEPTADLHGVVEQTGVSVKAAENLRKNAGGYWEALSYVLESNLFWSFLKVMETYKRSGVSSDFGKYVNAMVEGAGRALMPEPDKADREIFKEEYFRGVCNRYCWEIMDRYKNAKEG